MSTEFRIQSNLSMANIATVASELRGWLATGIIVLNVTELSEPDLSVLQLIESLRAQARLQGGDVRLSAPANQSLTALLHRAGFTDAMTPADDHNFWFHGVPLQ